MKTQTESNCDPQISCPASFLKSERLVPVTHTETFCSCPLLTPALPRKTQPDPKERRLSLRLLTPLLNLFLKSNNRGMVAYLINAGKLVPIYATFRLVQGLSRWLWRVLIRHRHVEQILYNTIIRHIYRTPLTSGIVNLKLDMVINGIIKCFQC